MSENLKVVRHRKSKKTLWSLFLEKKKYFLNIFFKNDIFLLILWDQKTKITISQKNKISCFMIGTRTYTHTEVRNVSVLENFAEVLN